MDPCVYAQISGIATGPTLQLTRRKSGFSFEAGGRTFRPVVCYSTSGTLRSILAIFFTTVNGVSEYSILKISWGSMPPDPPRCLRLRRSRGALRRQENIHVRCFQKYVRYFTKQLKTLRKCMTTGCSDVQINDFSERFSLFRRSFIRN